MKRHTKGEWHWRSLKVIGIADITWPYITSYYRSVVITTTFCTVSEILPHICGVCDCRDLEKFFVIGKTVELQATCAFWFIYKRVIENRPMYYISWGMGDRKVPNSESDLQGCSKALTMVPSIGHIGFPVSGSVQLCYCLAPLIP